MIRSDASARVARVRAELRDDSSHVDTALPRLSWTVESASQGWVQAGAELRTAAESVRLPGRASVLVEWPFAPLRAGETREVQVRVTSTFGTTTEWSEPLAVTAAFTDTWVAQPIGLPAPDAIGQPALLRTEFSIDRPVEAATLHWTALGVLEVELNGAPADDLVLSPGWTSYHERLIHETTDVTALLVDGANAIGIRLAGGWYTEAYSVVGERKRFYGDQPRALAQLDVTFSDGTSRVIATDGTWRASGTGPVISSGIYAGEEADARLESPGWSAPGFDDSAWSPVVVDPIALPRPEARSAPPVRRTGRVAVQEVLRSPDGHLILDFGQNLVGRLRLRVDGPAGTVITLKHAEVLSDGELALAPLRGAAATDRLTLPGGPIEWEPRFTFHGFRYAQIEGWPGAFDPNAVEAVIVGSDLTRTGWFESSDDLLNRFHENVVWTTRGNYLSIPMDCPQRDERLGWTGDTQLFAPTATFLYDCHAFYRSWLRELALEQRRLDGVVPQFAPDVVPDVAARGAVAAWGDAMSIMPPLLAQRYGDGELLREFWPAIRDWAEVLLRERDEDGLWTTGRQLGDWLDPSAPPNAPGRSRTETELVAGAYLVHTLDIAAGVASAVDDAAAATRFATEAGRSRRAFLTTYVTPRGRISGDTQTAYALVLRLGVARDPRLRQLLSDRLADLVRRDGYQIATGLLGTAHIAQALDEGGHTRAAERLLLQRACPSWLYPVTVGATTVWERWDGLRPDGSLNPGHMTSFNHVALGSVAAWLHSAVAGIAPSADGWQSIRIAPRPLEALTHASARHLTPYGPAEVRWERAGGRIRLSVTVPPNAAASVVLHDLVAEVGSGSHEWFVDEPPATTRPPLTLESSLAELIDDSVAFEAFWAALATASPFLQSAIRGNAQWLRGRTISDLLIFAGAETRSAIARAISR